MPCLELLVQVVQVAIAVVGGAIALCIAHRRFKIADRNRLEDQFLRGAQMLDFKSSDYPGRVAGAGTLADLAQSSPDEYDKRVMCVFQSFLDFPPRYGKNHAKENQVDYTSFDSVAVVEAINARADSEKEKYRIRLTEKRPYRVNDVGNVERNPDYDDPGKRQPDSAPPSPPPPSPQ